MMTIHKTGKRALIIIGVLVLMAAASIGWLGIKYDLFRPCPKYLFNDAAVEIHTLYEADTLQHTIILKPSDTVYLNSRVYLMLDVDFEVINDTTWLGVSRGCSPEDVVDDSILGLNYYLVRDGERININHYLYGDSFFNERNYLWSYRSVAGNGFYNIGSYAGYVRLYNHYASGHGDFYRLMFDECVLGFTPYDAIGRSGGNVSLELDIQFKSGRQISSKTEFYIKNEFNERFEAGNRLVRNFSENHEAFASRAVVELDTHFILSNAARVRIVALNDSLRSLTYVLPENRMSEYPLCYRFDFNDAQRWMVRYYSLDKAKDSLFSLPSRKAIFIGDRLLTDVYANDARNENDTAKASEYFVRLRKIVLDNDEVQNVLHKKGLYTPTY